jgi:hypothetical protein
MHINEIIPAKFKSFHSINYTLSYLSLISPFFRPFPSFLCTYTLCRSNSLSPIPSGRQSTNSTSNYTISLSLSLSLSPSFLCSYTLSCSNSLSPIPSGRQSTNSTSNYTISLSLSLSLSFSISLISLHLHSLSQYQSLSYP